MKLKHLLEVFSVEIVHLKVNLNKEIVFAGWTRELKDSKMKELELEVFNCVIKKFDGLSSVLEVAVIDPEQVKYFLTATEYNANGYAIGSGDFHKNFIKNNEFTDKEEAIQAFDKLVKDIKENQCHKNKGTYEYLIDLANERESIKQATVINQFRSK